MKKSEFRSAIGALFAKPVRNFLGIKFIWTYEHCFRPVLGFIFDLMGARFRVNGCTIKVPKHLTTRTYRGCFMIDDYEAGERALVREFVRPDDSVLELGSCIGAVSCVTNRLLADKSRHVVVEANPKLIPCITENRDINQCGFTILNMAASTEKSVTFYLHDEFIVGGTAQRPSSQPVTLEGITLDELDALYGPFSVLIMDIEGAETEIIPPSLEFLKKCRLVIWETHDWACGTEATKKCRDALSLAGLKYAKAAEDSEAWIRRE